MKITLELLDFGVRDNCGDLFDPEAVKKAVEERGAIGIPVYADFKDRTLKGTIGVANNLRIEGTKVFADVELLDTPEGQAAQAIMKSEKPMELAMGGRVSGQYAELAMSHRTISDFTIDDAALTHTKVK